MASNAIFISEIADPENNADARFLELYNASESPIPLKGWRLLRYTNGNTGVGSVIDLTGYAIPARNTFVIAKSRSVFMDVYGGVPDLEAGGGSPADSNGDDTIVLVDYLGEVRDILGTIGVDGSGTAHEFEDGKALRKKPIIRGSPLFNSEEWEVFNDSGQMGTILAPQEAPHDFTPGIR